MRALVVDDHPLIQEAVSNVLRRLAPDADIVAAADCERGLALAQQADELDLVLLDLNLPGISGIPALKLWRTTLPGVPVVILSATTDSQTVLAALGAGAAGFIPKSSSNEVMLSALRLVLEGGRYIPAEVLAQPGALRRPVRSVEHSTRTLGLSPRQTEVLRLLATGAPNKVICRELGLADRTVKAHVTAVLRALNVSSRTQAALEAVKLGLAGVDAPSKRNQP